MAKNSLPIGQFQNCCIDINHTSRRFSILPQNVASIGQIYALCSGLKRYARIQALEKKHFLPYVKIFSEKSQFSIFVLRIFHGMKRIVRKKHSQMVFIQLKHSILSENYKIVYPYVIPKTT